MAIARDAALRIYERMALIRAVESRLVRGIGAGELQINLYETLGQEAIPSVLVDHLSAGDVLLSTYRNIHDCIAKGVPLEALIGELLGRRTGTSKGKGGSMHIVDPEHGLMMTTGIVGGGLPVGVGIALAQHLRGTDRVTVACFGDGATSTGAAHEAMNLAAVWQLPILFVCQNNQYGEHTHISDYTRSDSLVSRALSYGMRAEAVSGTDVLALYAATADAVDSARTGRGPTFLECTTLRLTGHLFGMSTQYMDSADLAQARATSAIDEFRLWLEQTGTASEMDVDDIDSRARAAAEAAVTSALAEEPPDLVELLTDVFASGGPTT